MTDVGPPRHYARDGYRDESSFLRMLAELIRCGDQQTHAATAALSRIFEVAGIPFQTTPSRPAGITSDGGAFECSVKVSQSNVSLRFIVDPLSWRYASAARMAADHARLWHEPESPQLKPLLAAFHLDGAFTGNFRAWLGAATCPTGETAGKLYLNPHLPPTANGLLGMYRFIAAAGIETTFIPVLREVLTACGPFVPHIVGLNFGSDGVKAVKAYLVLPEPPLENLMHLAWGRKALLERISRLAEHLTAHRGQVHLSLSFFEAYEPPTLSLQFMASSWFASPVLAGKAADALLRSEGVGSVPGRAHALSTLGITFVGVGESATYVYAAPPVRGAKPQEP